MSASEVSLEGTAEYWRCCIGDSRSVQRRDQEGRELANGLQHAITRLWEGTRGAAAVWRAANGKKENVKCTKRKRERHTKGAETLGAELYLVSTSLHTHKVCSTL